MVPQAVLLAVAVAMVSAMVYLFDQFLSAGKKLDELEGKVALKADLDKLGKTLTDKVTTSQSTAVTSASAKVDTRFRELQTAHALAVEKVKDDLETDRKAWSDEMLASLTKVQEEVGQQQVDSAAALAETNAAITTNAAAWRQRSTRIEENTTNVEAVRRDQAILRDALAQIEPALAYVKATADETYERIEAAERDVKQNTLLRQRFEYAGTSDPVRFCDLDGDDRVGCRTFSFLDATPPALA
jgi:gas vesicle protein